MAENLTRPDRGADGSPRFIAVASPFLATRAATVRERLPLRRAASGAGPAPRFGGGSSALGIDFSNGYDEKRGRPSDSSAWNPIVSNNIAARESEVVPFFRDFARGQKSSYHEIS